MGDKKLKTWKKLFSEPDDEEKVLRKIKVRSNFAITFPFT